MPELSHDPDWKVRKSETEALANFRGHRAELVPLLVQVLDDPEPEVVRAAIISLGRVGRGFVAARDGIARFSDSPTPIIKESAVIARANMSGIEDPAIPVIVKALGSSEEPLAKLAASAITGAGAATVEKLIPALMENLQSDNEVAVTNTLAVMRQMNRHYGQLATTLAEGYDNVKPETRPKVLQSLSLLDKTGTISIPVMLKAFEDQSPVTRKQALIGLARSGRGRDVLVPVVKAALKDPDVEVRVQALVTIRPRSDKMLVEFPQVISATQDPDPRIRIAALNTLIGFDNAPQDPVQVLEQIAKEDKDSAVRTAAFTALAGVSWPRTVRVVPFIENALKNEENSDIKDFLKATIDGMRRRMARENDGIVPGEQLGN